MRPITARPALPGPEERIAVTPSTPQRLGAPAHPAPELGPSIPGLGSTAGDSLRFMVATQLGGDP